MKHILVDMPVEPAALRRLQSIPDINVNLIESHEESHAVPASLVNQIEILFCDALPSNFRELNALKWIQIGSVGYSHLYGLSLPERGIRVTNARGVFDVAIAEWCLAMMINLIRDMPAMFRNQQECRWNRDGRFQSELRGATLGVYGYGGIGRETARLAKVLGLCVWVLSRGPLKRRERIYRVAGTGDPEGTLPDRVFDLDQKFEFFAGLDYLLLSMPLTSQTECIIGAHELEALPQTAFILNPARGPLIDEAALLDALRSGRIRGAALDAHYQYPLPPSHPLWAMENVILTPHISGSSDNPHYLKRLWDVFEWNVRCFVNGELLWNELTRQELRIG